MAASKRLKSATTLVERLHLVVGSTLKMSLRKVPDRDFCLMAAGRLGRCSTQLEWAWLAAQLGNMLVLCHARV